MDKNVKNIIVVASGHSCVVVVVDGLVLVLELICLCFERGDLGIVYECDFDLQKDSEWPSWFEM